MTHVTSTELGYVMDKTRDGRRRRRRRRQWQRQTDGPFDKSSQYTSHNTYIRIHYDLIEPLLALFFVVVVGNQGRCCLFFHFFPTQENLFFFHEEKCIIMATGRREWIMCGEWINKMLLLCRQIRTFLRVFFFLSWYIVVIWLLSASHRHRHQTLSTHIDFSIKYVFLPRLNSRPKRPWFSLFF